MTTRDEYVAKLKMQLDHWNEDMGRWESQAASAHAQAKKQYAKQLDALRAKREEAAYQLTLLEAASAAAWRELAKGADEAWARMRDAVGEARTHFEGK